ncbi:hypothetical protein Q6301_26450, partial [Klebsiella quasipneumoniae]|nr:hypothetical protein [Klebsiella quasipneumoniae]
AHPGAGVAPAARRPGPLDRGTNAETQPGATRAAPGAPGPVSGRATARPRPDILGRPSRTALNLRYHRRPPFGRWTSIPDKAANHLMPALKR